MDWDSWISINLAAVMAGVVMMLIGIMVALLSKRLE